LNSTSLIAAALLLALHVESALAVVEIRSTPTFAPDCGSFARPRRASRACIEPAGLPSASHCRFPCNLRQAEP